MLWTTVRSLFSPGAWLTEETGATSMLYPFYFTQVYCHCRGQATLANYSPAYYGNITVFLINVCSFSPWYWLNIPAIVGHVQCMGQQRGKFRQQKDIISCYNWNYLSINPVRTNGPTLCPIVWLPYAPKYVDKFSQRGTLGYLTEIPREVIG